MAKLEIRQPYLCDWDGETKFYPDEEGDGGGVAGAVFAFNGRFFRLDIANPNLDKIAALFAEVAERGEEIPNYVEGLMSERRNEVNGRVREIRKYFRDGGITIAKKEVPALGKLPAVWVERFYEDHPSIEPLGLDGV